MERGKIHMITLAMVRASRKHFMQLNSGAMSLHQFHLFTIN